MNTAVSDRSIATAQELSVLHRLSAKHGHLKFVVLIGLVTLPFMSQCVQLFSLAAADERYSQVALIPFISAGLTYLDHKRMFAERRSAHKVGIGLLVCAAALHFGVARWLDAAPALTVSTCALVLAWIAAFILCYGVAACRAAWFPLFLLGLTVPLPAAAVMDRVSYALQVCSAEIAFWLFKMLGVPIFREGFFLFSLPGQVILVAEECSGIRSAIAFFITSLLLGHLFIRSGWRRLTLVAIAVSVAIIKNSVRIVVLTSAGRYLGVDLLNSSLHHHYGGTVFSLPAIALVVGTLVLLRRTERLNKLPV